MLLIPPKYNMIHGLILFHINQNLHIMELLIFMGNMVTGILSKIPRFTASVLITMMNIMTSQLEVLLTMQLPYRLMIIIFSHLDLFKYQNVIFKVNNVTTMHPHLYLVGYFMTPLNRYFLIHHSMPVYQLVTSSKIIPNHNLLQ